MPHSKFLQIAIEQAVKGAIAGSDSAGAVLVKGDKIISQSHDQRMQHNNPMATAEMECIRLAGRRNDQSELVLYATCYPDMLVAGTILQFSIGALVIGLPEVQSQAIDLLKSKNVPITFLAGQGQAQ